MAEWYEKYRNASEKELIVQALEACSRLDCNHCHQGNSIKCYVKLKLDAARLLREAREKPPLVAGKELIWTQ